MPRRYFLILLFLPLTTAAGGQGALPGARPVEGKGQVDRQAPSYAGDIRPLLQAKCARCHGGRRRRADLDLTTPAGILKGGESGPAVVPGKPDDSLLYEKVHSGAMPPGRMNRLSAAEVATLRRWIAAGARAGSGAAGDPGPTAGAVTQHDVIPILLRRCAACHGARRREGGLDLRTRAAMLRGGKSGPAIVPGKPHESRILQKIHSGQMPPRDRLVEASVRPIEPAETEVLARWVAAGAPEVDLRPDVATTTPDPLVTEKDRDFWAFRAPRPVSVPAVRDARGARNPIDAFILQGLERKGLTLSPEADRATLLRRAYLDLAGLPPEPAEVQAFLADRSPDAYEKRIDRLLASPRYGERWGRYWLDLAGYADSEGKREQDLPRPHAWRYRDYVIRAFNADKPYDRFLLEQLAGDELADCDSAPEVTPELYDNLVATGFLRMAPDPTWANITGFLEDRIEVIADEIDVLGSAVLGLTLKCARCHSHKFDPIPQRDYYRLLDVFKGAYDEHDWLKPDVRPGLGPVSQDVRGGRHLPHVTTAERRAWQAHNGPIQQEIDALRSSLERKARALKQLRIDLKTLKARDPDFRKEAEETERKVKALRARLLPEPRVQALWDRGEPSPTYVYRRGDPLKAGSLVGPGVPSVLTDGKTPFEVKPPWPAARKTGRRLAFARWLTRPDHPLTARVAVNRLWKHHFGTGLVKTLGNFGKAGARPTHPALLDWLARELVQRGWSLKAMHRLLMTSATYRQSSAVTPDRRKLDPENALLSRMPLLRLDAEALFDALLLVAGRLDETRFGPGDRVEARPDGLITPVGTAAGWRRLIYVRQARKQIPTHLENFDYPQMNPNCLERRHSTVAPQALHLMNNGLVRHLAEHFARRVLREGGTDPAKQVERVYLIALSRPPDGEEKRLGLEALGKLTGQWANQLEAVGKQDRSAAGLRALTSFCHAIMNSASFLYVD
jgi:mono/diheme cytochrome c family protein